MTKKAIKTSVITDFVRLLRRTYTPFSILLILGKMLQKRALRTMSIAAIAMWGVLLQSMRIAENSLLDSDLADRLIPHIETALITVSLLFPIGLIITGTFNLIALRYERKARMNNLILTGDMKKTVLSRPYLSMLWQQVYGPESLINPEFYHCQDEKHFVELAHQALNTAQPQCLQEEQVGIPLSLVESWSRIGVFTTEDELGPFITHHQTLREARLLMRHPFLANFWHSVKGEKNPSFWHTLTIRKIKLSIGRHLIFMNKRHKTKITGQYFRAEHYVWPHKSIDALVEKTFPGEETILELKTARHRMFRSTFTDSWPLARRHILRMFKQDYVAAMKLRLRFDPEYVLSGDADKEIDLLESICNINVYSERKLRKAFRDAEKSHAVMHTWLNERNADEMRNIDAETIRALWVALQVNHLGMKKKLHKLSVPEVFELLGPISTYSRCLRKIREIQILARYQIDVYLFLVAALGGYLTQDQVDNELTPGAAELYHQIKYPPWLGMMK